MKIRNGFVSNSSSSSFCIYGVHFPSDELKSKIKSIPTDVLEQTNCWKSFMKQDDEWAKEKTIDVFFKECNVMNIFEDIKGLCIYCSPPGEYYIGRNYISIRDDESGADFKQSVKDKLEPFGFKRFGKYEEVFNDNF